MVQLCLSIASILKQCELKKWVVILRCKFQGRTEHENKFLILYYACLYKKGRKFEDEPYIWGYFKFFREQQASPVLDSFVPNADEQNRKHYW